MYKKEGVKKRYLRKRKTFSMLWMWEPVFIDLSKKINMPLSKAFKIEMLKKQQRNNNSIFLILLVWAI